MKVWNVWSGLFFQSASYETQWHCVRAFIFARVISGVTHATEASVYHWFQVEAGDRHSGRDSAPISSSVVKVRPMGGVSSWRGLKVKEETLGPITICCRLRGRHQLHRSTSLCRVNSQFPFCLRFLHCVGKWKFSGRCRGMNIRQRICNGSNERQVFTATVCFYEVHEVISSAFIHLPRPSYAPIYLLQGNFDWKPHTQTLLSPLPWWWKCQHIFSFPHNYPHPIFQADIVFPEEKVIFLWLTGCLSSELLKIVRNLDSFWTGNWSHCSLWTKKHLRSSYAN